MVLSAVPKWRAFADGGWSDTEKADRRRGRRAGRAAAGPWSRYRFSADCMDAAGEDDADPFGEARDKSLRWGKVVGTSSEAMAPPAEGIGTEAGGGLRRRRRRNGLSQRLPLCEDSEMRAGISLRR